VREYTIPATFTIEDHDSVVSSVFAHERDDPDYVILRRLVDGKWTDVTCLQAAAQIRAAAQGLIAEGVAAGDRVAVLSATRYEWPILDYAILAVGAVTVPIYETSSAEQVRWVLEDSGAVLIFTEDDDHTRMVNEMHAELPALRKVVQIEKDGVNALDVLAQTGMAIDPTEIERRLAGLRSSDAATLIYTSGTTGRPKGCQLTHFNLLSEIRGNSACFPTLLRKNERLLVFLPMAHVLSRALSMTAFTNKVTLGYTSDIKNLVPMLQVFKPTIVVSVPRVFEKVYNTAELNAQDSGKGKIFELAVKTAIAWSEAQDSKSSGPLAMLPNLGLDAAHAVFDKLVYGKLRAALGGECRAAISGGAPLGKRLGHFYRGVGLPIYEGYGLTETSAAITINRVGELEVGTVGKLVPGNTMAVAPDGELLVRGGVVFSGYWQNETATNEAIVDGWFHTGDLASVDANGFLSITGRKKEIIVTAGGKNVAPAVLEDALRAHPLISQAMAVGDAQPFIGALIAIDPESIESWKQHKGKDAGASVSDLRDDPDLIAEIEQAVKSANQHVSHAESIRKFRILPCDFTVQTGELTPTLKVKRAVVAQKFADEIAAIYTK